jgi:hypothetical protein
MPDVTRHVSKRKSLPARALPGSKNVKPAAERATF